MAVVLAYDFPHRKTQDVLFRCKVDGIPVEAVVAAPFVRLDVPSSTLRTKVRDGGLVHPRDVCDALGYPYHVVPHADCGSLLDALGPEVGIIAGARVVPASVVEAFGTGVINLHPGPLPEARGLDALLWCIHEDLEPFVTAHLIDERVDAGRSLLRRRMRVHPDDTLFDLTHRAYTMQLEMLRPAFDAAQADEAVPLGRGPYRGKMGPVEEAETLERLPAWLEGWS